jgi:hypothetical protein
MNKKPLLLLLVIIMAVFVYGCQSTTDSVIGNRPDSSAKMGYPEGHDNHPATKKDRMNDYHPLMDYS